MPWIKVDVLFPAHCKTMDIGPIAEALWLRGLCYAGEHLTDGLVPRSFVRRMGDLDGDAEAARLVAAGLWHETDTGWLIHDYLDWQRSRAEADDLRIKRAEAGSRGGKQKASNLLEAKQKASKLPSKPVANVKQKASNVPENLGNPSKPSKTLADKKRGDTEENRERTPPTPQGGEIVVVEVVQPWDLFAAMCTELGRNPADFSETDKKPQLRAAKQLVDAGATPDDIRRMTRWLAGQDWIIKGGGIDMRMLAGQRAKWLLADRPGAPPAAAPPRSPPAPPNVVDRVKQMLTQLQSLPEGEKS